MKIEDFLALILAVEILKTGWVIYADSVIINYRKTKRN